MLALTHVSPRYGGRELRDEARAAFAEARHTAGTRRGRVIVPRDFDRVEIPFPERGDPLHVKASERPPEQRRTRAPSPAR